MRTIKETVAVTVLVEVEYEDRPGARSDVLIHAEDHLTRSSHGCYWSHGYDVEYGVQLVGRSAVAAMRPTKLRITRGGKVRR